jgi:enoyl-CoA hydratase/carnithine racemase
VEHRPGGVVHVVLHGPRTLGAQTPDTWLALGRAAADLPAGTRVVVLRGSGRAFSSGLDRSAVPLLGELGRRPPADVVEQVRAYQAAFTCWRPPGILTVAAVAGPAVGAGFQLALACDLRLAAADAAFRMAETSLGLVPDLAGTGPLVRAVGEQAALEICLTGRTVGAEEALRLGLVRAVVGVDELEQATDDLVGAVLASPEAAVRETLDLLRGAGGRAPEEQQRREREAQSRLLAGLVAPAADAPHGGVEGAGPARR